MQPPLQQIEAKVYFNSMTAFGIMDVQVEVTYLRVISFFTHVFLFSCFYLYPMQ